jgi:hypothetical protein
LPRRGSFVAGLAEKGLGAVNGLALCALNGAADMLPLVAAWQVCHTPFEAAMKEEPLVLVSQREHEELIHQVAGPGGPCRQETIGGMSHAEQLGNRSGQILGVHHGLLRLYVKPKRGSECDQGAERLHRAAGDALQEVVICTGNGACRLHRGHLLRGVLEGQGKEQGPKPVPLANPRLGGHHGVVRPPHVQPAGMPVRPSRAGQQGRASRLHGHEHLITAEGIECVLPVYLDCNATRLSSTPASPPLPPLLHSRLSSTPASPPLPPLLR